MKREIGELIKLVRKERGFSREQLSDCCSSRALQNIENGKAAPSRDTLDKLSRKLNVDFISYVNESSDDHYAISHEDREELRLLRENRNYPAIHIKTNNLLHSDIEFNINDRQLLVYYRAVSLYFAKHDFEGVMKYIDENSSFTFDSKITPKDLRKYLSDFEVKLILFKSYLLLDNEKNEECVSYLEQFKLEDRDYSYESVARLKLVVKVEYNRLLSSVRLNPLINIEDDLNLAIKICLKYSMYDSLSKYYWLAAKYYFGISKIDLCHRYCYMYLILCIPTKVEVMYKKYIKVFKDEYDYDHKKYAISKL